MTEPSHVALNAAVSLELVRTTIGEVSTRDLALRLDQVAAVLTGKAELHTKNDITGLRDAILLEADWLVSHADRIRAWVEQLGGVDFCPATESMAAAAISCRSRARLLHMVLAATEPKPAAPALPNNSNAAA